MAGADEARIRDPRHFRSVGAPRPAAPPIQHSGRIAPRSYDAKRGWVVGSDAVCANWSGGVANLKKPRGTGWRPSGTNCPPFKQTKRLTKPGIDPSMPAEAGVRLDTGLPLRNEAGLRSTQDMTRHVKIGEAKTHLSALLAEVEAGEDLVICRGQTPIAHVTGINGGQDHAALCATLRRERSRQQAVTTSEILSWRHEGHTR